MAMFSRAPAGYKLFHRIFNRQLQAFVRMTSPTALVPLRKVASSLGYSFMFGTACVCSTSVGTTRVSCFWPFTSKPDVAEVGNGFMAALSVVPHSILGSQMKQDKSIVQAGTEPDSMTAIVDAGGHHIPQSDCPSRAAGAAKSIYKWIGISNEESFPADVAGAVRQMGDAKYHMYEGGRHVIHVYGPDLRKPCSDDDAVEALSRAYYNILKEFTSSDLQVLRLLPVSGGIMAGNFKARMPEITVAALRRGFAKLPKNDQDKLLGKSLQLCIFSEADAEAFRSAVKMPLPEAAR
eukprot:TRINITY_DN107827_c0_g1_i1.p1 TRINITY_DN107827_c0_g1~~TRINITY_DN107827_c0_g1_i1.p1  ORF type:complete len:293 (+),score=44.05 TRINITY_DN107827_c0_g1_i1:49-927(+)